jgi:hypothetical protein
MRMLAVFLPFATPLNLLSLPQSQSANVPAVPQDSQVMRSTLPLVQVRVVVTATTIDGAKLRYRAGYYADAEKVDYAHGGAPCGRSRRSRADW